MEQNNQIDSNLKPKQALYKQAESGLLNAGNLAILLVLFLTAKFLAALIFPQDNLILASDLTPDNILTAVNQQRSLRNLVTLNTNSKLTFAGQSKADDMQARHYFAHIDPDGHYIWDRIMAAGYAPYVQLGENLAIEFYDTDSLVAAWMNSPTHRANILQEGFKDDGLGLAFGDNSQGRYHSAIVNTFGTLASAPKPKKTTASLPPAPPKVSSKPATPPPLPAKPVPAPPPPAAAAQPQTAPVSSVPPKGTEIAVANPDANFYFPSKNQTIATATPKSQADNKVSAPGIVGNAAGGMKAYDSNRYLILIVGLVLLFLAGSDLKQAAEKKLAHVDKKINNLVVLLIALAVIAFMYWV